MISCFAWRAFGVVEEQNGVMLTWITEGRGVLGNDILCEFVYFRPLLYVLSSSSLAPCLFPVNASLMAIEGEKKFDYCITVPH